METTVKQEKERGRAEFASAKDVEGVSSPSLTWKTSDTHYLEMVVPNGADMVFHVFSFLDDSGSWNPASGGMDRIITALGKAKESVRLPASDRWAELTWEEEVLPEYFHQAMQRFEVDVQEWLIHAGIYPGVIRCDELLKEIKKRAFPKEWTDFQRHLSLTSWVRKEGMREVLRRFGHEDIPDLPGPDVSYLDNIIPVHAGSWCVYIFDLVNLVMDRSQLAEAFLKELSDASG